MLAGALLLLGPALLKTRFGVDEVVTTLLLNFIVLLFVSMLLEGAAEGPDGPGLAAIAARSIAEAQLPRIIQGTRLHFGFVIGARRGARRLGHHEAAPRFGYEMRAVGHNARGARASPASRSTAC